MTILSRYNVVKSSYALREESLLPPKDKEALYIDLYGDETKVLNNSGQVVALAETLTLKDKEQVINGKKYIVELLDREMHLFYSKYEDKLFDYIKLEYNFNLKDSFEELNFQGDYVLPIIFDGSDTTFLIWRNKLYKIYADELRNQISVIEEYKEKPNNNHSVMFWSTNTIHKNCDQFSFKGLNFLDTKKIKIAARFQTTSYNVDLQWLENKYVVKEKDVVLGEINDKRSINTVKSLNKDKYVAVLKDNELTFYIMAKVNNSYEKLAIKKSAEIRTSNYQLERLIKKGCRFGDKVWMFFSKSQNQENNSEFILHLPENKNYVFTIHKSEVVLKRFRNRSDLTKGKGTINAIVIKAENITIASETAEFSGKEEVQSEDSLVDITVQEKTAKSLEFTDLLQKYKDIEDKVLYEIKTGTGDISYKSILNSKFLIEDSSAESLEKWSASIGSGVNWISKNKEISIGVLKEVGQDYIKIDFSDDIIKSKISQNVGKLSLDFKPNETIQNRRERAVEMLQGEAAAMPYLKEILNGSYEFEDIAAKETVEKLINGRAINSKQYKAICGALNTDNIFLIQGPPGTGKTTVIRAIAEKIMEDSKSVLISSYQNLAVDNVIDGFLGQSIIPYRYGEKDEGIMKKICAEIVDDINGSINKNFSVGIEEGLEQYRLEIENLRKLFLVAVDKTEVLESLERLKALIARRNGRDKYCVRVENIIEEIKELSLKEDNKAVSIDAKHILPDKFELTYEFAEEIEHSIKQLKKLNKQLNNGVLTRVIDKLKKLCDADNMVELDEKSYEKEKLYIIGELKLLQAGNNKPQKDSLVGFVQQALECIISILEELPEYVEDNSYKLVKDFQKRINNSPILLEEILKKYADLHGTTCQKVGSYGFNVNTNGAVYSYVIIDEAARANPLDLLIPLIRGQKVVLVGDHKQLPHMLESYLEAKFLQDEEVSEKAFKDYIKDSLFERLFKTLPENRKIMLDTQYRMTEEIGNVVSELFYNNRLYTGTDIKNDIPFYEGRALVALDVKGEEKKISSAFSYYNTEECSEVLEKLRELNEKCTGQHRKPTVGIISFYKSQVDLIKRTVSGHSFANLELSVGTVDAYQGIEKDIIFLSTVRSKGIGFTSNENRLNVALSRAKKLVVLFSHMDNMKKDKLFGRIYEKCYKPSSKEA